MHTCLIINNLTGNRQRGEDRGRADEPLPHAHNSISQLADFRTLPETWLLYQDRTGARARAETRERSSLQKGGGKEGA